MNAFSSQNATIFAWLLCTLMLNTGTCTNFSIGCNQKDKLGLLNFKQRVIDLSGVLSSWNPDQDCCQWRGVNCDHITGRVIRLNLLCSTTLANYIDKQDKSHCLSGSIHLFLLLVELEFLNYLNLRNNDFLALQFDSIHQNCHNLSVVSHFHRSLNSSSLGYLDLSLNDNLAINSLQWLSRIYSLKYLNLGEIDLHKETNWLQPLTMLPSLSVLMMSDCQLKDLSPSLQYANFNALDVLNLSENEFSSELPKWLFNLSCDISYLRFARNSLRGQLP
ncbi:receptor-like protein EIX1 [Phaseolus vulgaris]|uniref:receptor-like protein EIX1 n=1 Tax=Phaseolus vulgaris TaxID=3885 RepID=UPI0035CAAF1E